MEFALPRCSCVFHSLLRLPCRGWLSPSLRRCITSTKRRNTKAHYTALGITPAATQADVKAAYYKLTKLYHPDRQPKAGDAEDVAEDNIKKFREVTAAYEVLGNVKLRRLYDKGMHHSVSGAAAQSTQAWRAAQQEDDDPAMKFYRSREVKHRPPAPTGSTPIYDFGEWSKQHYGATFAREQDIKRRQNMRTVRAAQMNDEAKLDRILIVMGVMLITILIISADRNKYDQATFDRSVEEQQAKMAASTTAASR